MSTPTAPPNRNLSRLTPSVLLLPGGSSHRVLVHAYGGLRLDLTPPEVPLPTAFVLGFVWPRSAPARVLVDVVPTGQTYLEDDQRWVITRPISAGTDGDPAALNSFLQSILGIHRPEPARLQRTAGGYRYPLGGPKVVAAQTQPNDSAGALFQELVGPPERTGPLTLPVQFTLGVDLRLAPGLAGTVYAATRHHVSILTDQAIPQVGDPTQLHITVQLRGRPASVVLKGRVSDVLQQQDKTGFDVTLVDAAPSDWQRWLAFVAD